MVQNASKDVKVSEKDLFKTARVASKLSKNNDVTGLIGKDRDEAELRNKLVSNLKEKEIKKMKECGDKIRNDKLYSDGEESREEISDDEEDNISGSPRDRDDRRDRDERRHRIAVAKVSTVPHCAFPLKLFHRKINLKAIYHLSDPENKKKCSP